MASSYTPVEVLTLAVQQEIALVPQRLYPTLTVVQKAEDYQTLIKWPANVGGATATGRATSAASRVTASADTVVGAQLPIGAQTLGHSFDILRNDLVQARNAGPGALKNLFAYQAQTGVEVILKGLNGLLYTGAGAGSADAGVYGMEYICTAANDYAGLAVATYANWVPMILTNASNRALTVDLLSALRVGLARKGGYADVIFTTPELVETYNKLFAANRQLSVPAVGPIADLGFADSSYYGIPMVADPDCTANAFYFVNSRGVKLHTFNLSNSAPEGAMAPEATKTMGLNFLVAQVGTQNPHVLSFEISVQPQLQVHNRAKDIALLGKITY
ncbi:MAG TPA: phage major capsid protein [Coleofasciculaceae cyanobacterium]|jgi:hypothetical protein